MTQSEFELQLLDLKQKQAKEIGTIEKMQQQVKEELAAKKRTCYGIDQDCAKLRQELSLLHKRHLELSAKWGGKSLPSPKSTWVNKPPTSPKRTRSTSSMNYAGVAIMASSTNSRRMAQP